MNDKDRIASGIWILWLVFHIIVALVSGNGDFFEMDNYFFPFSYDSELGEYDISEFLSYLIIPVLLYIAFRILNPEFFRTPEENE
tara:strand:+ start:44 stop:298 length:255 start_codon:yes stop_codon:yes gene_type:complete